MMLGWIYAALFVCQLLWLVWACRKHKKIWPVLTANILSIGVSVFLLWYFDTLPGYGMMPGLTWFAEVFYSICAAVVFAVLVLVTFLCMLYHKKK